MSGDGYWDDVRGGLLDVERVKKGRADEMGYVKRHRIYEIRTREECLRVTGRPPIKTGWADTDKGTEEEPNVRSRWVAKEYNTGARPDL